MSVVVVVVVVVVFVPALGVATISIVVRSDSPKIRSTHRARSEIVSFSSFLLSFLLFVLR